MPAYYHYNGKSITSVSEIPKTKHWAVYENSQYYSDDGYPKDGSYAHNIINYYAFTDEQKWRAYIAELLKEAKSFKAALVNPIEIITSFETIIK